MADNSVAVAIVTRDRPDSLSRAIDALLAQTRRPNEIIIVDDGRLDDARVNACRDRCEAAGVGWLYRRKSAPGRSASRNLAGSLTDCDTVCFMDDDCEPAPHCLERLLAGLDAYGRWQVGPEGRNAIVAVEGLVIPPGGVRLGNRLFAALLRACGWWVLARTRWPRKLTDHVRSRPVLGSTICLVRRDVLRATPFRESLSHGEDREWSVRVARLGRIARVTDAACIHHFDPAGRSTSLAGGAVIARNYLHSQRKLFGLRGSIVAVFTLLGLSIGELLLGLAATVAFRRVGPSWIAQSVGLLAGLLTSRGRRAD
ncbi:MAG: glycosyltransferase [Phycisphaerae bacterium]|nr:glycosyltransferase [Phycisphaerae bacterium]